LKGITFRPFDGALSYKHQRYYGVKVSWYGCERKWKRL